MTALDDLRARRAERETSLAPIRERTQVAMEAFWDIATSVGTKENVETLRLAAESAIETATRVRITSEVERAFLNHPDEYEQGNVIGPLTAAFRAAGFEVEQ